MEPDSGDPREIVVPLFTEEIAVSKRVETKGRVRVQRVTRQHQQLVDELLAREHVEIERIPVGKQVDSVPGVREEGDTIVIPIVEEILTMERRLVLKEEVRIRKIRETERYQESVTLRKQEAVVTRLPAEESKAAGGS